MDPLKPSAALLCKLGSVIVHCDEMTSADGHHFDRVAMQNLLADSDVKEWLDAMGRMAFLPVKRKP
jgi:hypothetical protein